MNDIEKQELINILTTYENKTMEDYFNFLHTLSGANIDDMKVKFKEFYPNETNWSF